MLQELDYWHKFFPPKNDKWSYQVGITTLQGRKQTHEGYFSNPRSPLVNQGLVPSLAFPLNHADSKYLLVSLLIYLFITVFTFLWQESKVVFLFLTLGSWWDVRLYMEAHVGFSANSFPVDSTITRLTFLPHCLKSERVSNMSSFLTLGYVF